MRDAIVFTVAYRAFSCGRAKTIRIRYVWTHKDKILRFQKYPDTCGRGLRRSRIYKHCYSTLVMRFRNWDDRKLYTGWCMVKNSSIMTLPKQSLLKVSTYQNIVFLPETFEALLTSEDKKSSALASFNLARSGKLLKIYVRYNGSHNLGLYKSGFILL